ARVKESLDLSEARPGPVHHVEPDEVDPVHPSFARVAERLAPHRDLEAAKPIGARAVVASRELRHGAARVHGETLDHGLAPIAGRADEPAPVRAERAGCCGKGLHLPPALDSERADDASHDHRLRSLATWPGLRFCTRLRACNAC